MNERFQKWANERNLPANLDECENDVLDNDRCSSKFSEILPSMLLTSNRNGSS